MSGTALATTSARGSSVEGVGPVQFLDEQRPLEHLRVGGQHAHAEGEGPAGDLAADAAQPDDQQRLAQQLVEDDPGPLEPPLFLRAACG